jgi:hypothetical protein
MATYFDLVLFGNKTDASGIPKPFHRYRIEVTSWLKPGSGIATIIPTTDDTPAPQSQHIIVKKGGVKQAAKAAREAIEAIPQNKGLVKRGNCP